MAASDQDWQNASTALNKYVSDSGGGDINWEKARSVFDQHADSGQGNYGDWVNNTFNAKDSWTTPKGGYQAPATPTTAWNREAFRDTSMARPVGQTAQDFINQNGYAGQVKFVPGSNDKVILPSGEVMDLSINANAQGQGTGNGWTGQGHWDGTKIVPYAPGAGGGGGGVGGADSFGAGGGSSTSSTTMTAQQQQDAALHKQLVDQLTQRSQQSLAVDRNDPVIRAQADAYGANEERAKRNYLADIAEKRGPIANMQGEERLASERVGQRTGGYEADLMGRELTSRRAEITDALTQMRGMLTTDQEMSLRKELATMDDALGRLKLQQDSTQFNADMGYKNAALAQQGQLANNQLGFQYDNFDWERSPLNPKNIIPAGG